MGWSLSRIPVLLSRASVLAAVTLSVSVAHGQVRIHPTSDTTIRDASMASVTDAASRDRQFEQLEAELSSFEKSFSILRRVVKLTSPTVVHIEATKDAHQDGNLAASKADSKRVEEAGAGVVVQLRGKPYVITNRHVVFPSKLESVRIQLNDRTIIHPTRVWADPSTDIAVMSIPNTNVLAARIGNSDDVEIGDFVLAVGSPFGLAHSVTYGIISAKGRRNLELGNKAIEIQDFFQTDAAINPGNSGGPLMNLKGEVVAINTAIASNSGGNEGIGFSIPINLVMTVAGQLIDQGQLQRGYLGVQMENAFDTIKANRLGLDHPMGALVKAIKSGSPAEKAGLKVGDVVLEFDGVRIENDGHLVQTVGLTPVGRDVEAIVLRGGKKLRTRIVLTQLPSYE
ncbi:MAG: trypsin-like peptidase domain-containing protein [Pirellulales bacterium]